MSNYQNAELTFEFGFDLIKMQSELKALLDRSGKQGLVNLIRALIASGIDTLEGIEDGVAAIGGEHYYGYIESLLHEVEAAPKWLWFHDGTRYVLQH